MTTPPKVTAADAAAAAARIRSRHAGRDEPGQHLLTDDPRDVLRFLRQLGARRLRDDDDDQARHDVHDGLVLRLHLWWESADHERWLLEASETLGLPRRTVGAVLGITTSAGFADRLDRGRALFDPALRRPNEKLARAARRTPPAPADPPAGDTALRAFLGDLYARLDDLPGDLAEDVHDMRREAARTGPLDPAVRAALAGIVRDLLELGDANPVPAGTALAARYLGIPAGQPT
jgi:hypothetical protein